MGSPVINVQYVNDLEESVLIAYRYGDSGWVYSGSEVPPLSTKRTSIMIRGETIRFRASTKEGDVVMEREVRWRDSQSKPDDSIVIVIRREGE